MMARLTIVLVAFWGLTAAAPADQPIRVDLPVYEPETPNEAEYRPAPSEGRSNQLLNAGLFGQKFNVASNLISNSYGTASLDKVASINIDSGPLSEPVTTLEGAILEVEGLGSKTLSVKENVQHFVAGIFQPKPIVDTITEEEKYGNNGDKFYSTGKAIVGGAENVSNLINTVLEVPGTIFRQIANAASQKLNNLGGRIVGLYNK